MDSLDKLTIDTPEQTALEFPLAGIGSRFLAMAADTAIQFIVGIVVLISAGVLAGTLNVFSKASPQWIAAIVIICMFLLNAAYFAFFEVIWNGQTPGKRYAKLRVMKDDGRPIGVYEAIVRNLMRIVDGLPGIYGVGIICVLVNKENKRLGDFVAGTVVVHEKTLEGVRPVSQIKVDDTLPVFDASNISLEEIQLIETFLQRRDQWDPGVRTSMATQISLKIGDKLGVRVYGWPRTENFLEAVLQQCRSTGRMRQ